VIGAGTSAHDISAQLWDAGIAVTMIQRSPRIVTRIDSLLPAVEIYDTDAPAPKPPIELADLLVASSQSPYAVIPGSLYRRHQG
jgi:putative flavoprotein involved in K+ transport